MRASSMELLLGTRVKIHNQNKKCNFVNVCLLKNNTIFHFLDQSFSYKTQRVLKTAVVDLLLFLYKCVTLFILANDLNLINLNQTLLLDECW